MHIRIKLSQLEQSVPHACLAPQVTAEIVYAASNRRIIPDSSARSLRLRLQVGRQPRRPLPRCAPRARVLDQVCFGTYGRR